MNVQLAKIRPQALVLLEIESLIPEKEHVVMQQDMVEFFALRFGQGLPQVKSIDLGVNNRRDGSELEGFVRHIAVPLFQSITISV